jgi:hypothetical protein
MTLVAGVTYFFRIRNTGSTEPLTQPLQLSLTRAPNNVAPLGSIAVNDDAPGWPIVILSATDGSVLQARLTPAAGETGTILSNGLSIWHDSTVTPEVIRLYDAALSLRATAAWTFYGTSPPVTG